MYGNLKSIILAVNLCIKAHTLAFSVTKKITYKIQV